MLRLKLFVLIATVFTGCVNSAPTVSYETDGFDRETVWRGASAWVRGGFEFVDSGGDHHVIVRRADISATGKAGLARIDGGEIIISDQLEGWELYTVIAHEFGHVVLETPLHHDGVGVMASPSTSLTLTPDDYVFIEGLP